jgi:hypothetical protein
MPSFPSAAPIRISDGPRQHCRISSSGAGRAHSVATRGKDGCTVAAAGSYQQISDDVIYNVGIKASMTGVPDGAGPVLTVPSTGQVHPLSFTGVVVDELLPAATTATMAGGAAVVPLAPSPAGSTFGVSAFWLRSLALAFGSGFCSDHERRRPADSGRFQGHLGAGRLLGRLQRALHRPSGGEGRRKSREGAIAAATGHELRGDVRHPLDLRAARAAAARHRHRRRARRVGTRTVDRDRIVAGR